MPARDTTTGSNYEEIIRACIERSCQKNGLSATRQKYIGEKPGGGKHRIDWEIARQDDESIRGLISCKYQGTSGTAEEKIAYEVIKLLHAMDTDTRYKHSWIVLGGEGWSPGMKKFALSEIPKWVPAMKEKITLLTTDQLIAKDLKLE